MFVEVQQLFAQLRNYRNLVQQNFVQIFNVFFYVASGFVNHVEQAHLVFDDWNNFVDVLSVISYQIFFFFQNLLNQLVVVSFEPFNVLSVFFSQINLCWNIGTKRLGCILKSLSWCLGLEQLFHRCRRFCQIYAVSSSSTFRRKQILLYSCLRTLSLLPWPSLRGFQ